MNRRTIDKVNYYTKKQPYYLNKVVIDIKNINIVLFILFLTLILTGCKIGGTQNSPRSSDEEPKATVDLTKINYFNLELYSDNKDYREMISIINQNVKALNERDEQRYVSSFNSAEPQVKTNAESSYKTLVRDMEKYILNLEKAEFKKNDTNPNELQVIVSTEIQQNQQIKKETSVFIFKLEDNRWNLAYID
ncbi:hypothetical protein [Paenibacillus tyrfis]|uniref:hypothetical protein n=1 Tax=Paenibacillus tyrfis TaxID=1501230 RepID=UPI0020A011CB|nr:hypothetical protein [Paenibacillus tyrfis]MCP1312454.1 hypothetical protein [Paenibacillus tyrfis]